MSKPDLLSQESLFRRLYVEAADYTGRNSDLAETIADGGALWVESSTWRVLLMTGETQLRVGHGGYARAILDTMVAAGDVQRDACPLDDEVDIYVNARRPVEVTR